MSKLFTAHPQSQNETYISHATVALSISWMCFVAGALALVHSVFPFLFETGATTKLKQIQEYLDSKNRR